MGENIIMKILISLFLGIVVSLNADLNKDIKEAYQNGNLIKVKQLTEFGCEQKNALACFGLGFSYFNGKFTEINIRKGVSYYKKMCDYGDLSMCLNTVTSTDKQELLDYSLMIADKTCTSSLLDPSLFRLCNQVGLIRLGKINHESRNALNYNTSAKIFTNLCSLNNPEGCALLGLAYLDGNGVRQNKNLSKQYAGKACDLGNQTGCEIYKELNEQAIK